LPLLSTAQPALIVEFSDEKLWAAGQALMPFYTFEPLTAQHWLLLRGAFTTCKRLSKPEGVLVSSCLMLEAKTLGSWVFGGVP
jgi:hypothetical protein